MNYLRTLITIGGVLFATTASGWQTPNPSTSQTATAANALILARQAQASSTEGNWSESSALWDRAVQLDPVEPDWWFSLGVARYRSKDYKNAISAFEKASELGAPVMGAYNSIYSIARCYALLGDTQHAVDALTRAFSLGYPDINRAARDPDLAAIRRDPRVIELLGIKDVSKMSRDEGWRYDLALLSREVHRKGYNSNLYVHRTLAEQEFDQTVDRISQEIPHLTDGQVVLALMKLMVSIGDGHSAIFDAGENPAFQSALPMSFFWFQEGLFVTAADPRYRDLLGLEVKGMDGHLIAEILKATDPLIPRDHENPQVFRSRAPYLIRNLNLLYAAGLVNSPDHVTLSVGGQSGEARDIVVYADRKEPEIWNQLPAPPSWITLASTIDPEPLYLQHVDKAQWFQYLEREKIVYFQFNHVLNGNPESLVDFTARLSKSIEHNEVRALIIDMRWNNGGNTALGEPLLLSLIRNSAINQPGKLFVITGRRTFSAAQNMASYFERFTNAIFVGEPTGSSPNFVGEESPVTLPYSKLVANVSHLFWESSWPQDQRMWLAPQIYVPPTFADYKAGRDAALAAILDLQKQLP